jgi:uncharacterized membrane protein
VSRFIHRPPGQVFDWVADYRNVPKVMAGVSDWRPVGAQAEGVGAVYQVELGELGIPLRARLAIDEWRRPKAIGWRTESSLVGNRGRWLFRPRAGGTEVELAVTYEPPAGGLGNIVASGIEGVVRGRIEDALDRMKKELER